MTTTLAPPPAGTAPPRRRPRRATTTLGAPSALGLGVALVWFSLLVLIPLAAVLATAAAGGWENFIDTLTSPQTFAAVKLTVLQAAQVTLLNVVHGHGHRLGPGA